MEVADRPCACLSCRGVIQDSCKFMAVRNPRQEYVMKFLEGDIKRRVVTITAAEDDRIKRIAPYICSNDQTAESTADKSRRVKDLKKYLIDNTDVNPRQMRKEALIKAVLDHADALEAAADEGPAAVAEPDGAVPVEAAAVAEPDGAVPVEPQAVAEDVAPQVVVVPVNNDHLDQADGEGYMEQDEDDDIELVTEEQAVELEANEPDGSVEELEDLPNGIHNWVPYHYLLRPIRGIIRRFTPPSS